MPEKAVENIRKTIQKARDDVSKLIEETRLTRRELTPMPIRKFLEERLGGRARRRER